MSTHTTAFKGKSFSVALSFAGEQRDYVEEVALGLKCRGVDVFYDGFHEVELWGCDLVATLDDLYSKRTDAVVIFVSNEYVAKPFTIVERQAAMAKAISTRNKYIYPVKFDDVKLPGLPATISYLEVARNTPEQLAAKICQAIGASQKSEVPHVPPVPADDKDNTVTLSLDQMPRHDVDVGQPFINMRFEQQGTEFVGRTTELRELQDFLESEKRLAWWQVSGAGGQGKSRLGLQLIDMFKTEWHAGFLGTRGLDRDWNREDFNRPTLIIVDYLAAPGKARKFVEAIEALARRVPGADGQVTPDARPIKQPVRFLVLERAGFDDDAHTSNGAASWYGMIRQGARPAVTATRHAPHSLELRDLSPEEMIAIANSWRTGRELPPLSDTQTRKLVSLMDKSGHSGRQKAWRPLFAMMLGERIDRFDRTLNVDDAIEDILCDVLKAEQEEVWPRDNNREPAALSPQALNLACLTSMIGIYDHNSHAETLESAAPDKAAFGEFYGAFDPCHLKQTNTALGYHVQPLGRTGVAPLVARQPDLLAEYQVLLELGAKPMLQGHRTRLARLTEDAFRLAPSDLTAFFVRLAEDFPKHATARALFEAQLPADALSMHSDRQDQTQFADDLDANLPSYFGLVGLMRAYLSKGADISKQTSNGAFPLLLAAQEGHAGIVAALVKAGVNVDAVNSKSGTFPLLQAAQNGHAMVVAELVKAGADVDAVNSENGTFPLLQAAQNDHAGIVADLVEAGANVDAVDSKDGTFPLLMAAQEGHAGVVGTLVKAGANVNAVNSENGTFPLLMAAQNDHVGVVAALVKAGANVNAVNSENGTFPLLQAAQNGHARVVAELVKAGADVDAVNSKSGTFPLLLAAQEGHAGVVGTLVKAGANVNAVNSENGTFPLLMAAQNDHVGVVAALVKAGANVNAVNSENGTFPLLQAAQNGHARVVAELVKAGADVDAVNSKSGTFPLLLAAQNGHARVVAELVKAGADVDAVNSKRGTFPLLQAAQNGHARVVAELVKAGADVDAVNSKNGTFPLLLAAQNDHAGIVEELIEAGADPRRAHEKTGMTALDLAVMAGNGALIEILTDALGRAC